ncbi:MAG: hypothetical protein ACUZ8H_12415 [Candidatus Anammoxibacter sp.]
MRTTIDIPPDLRQKLVSETASMNYEEGPHKDEIKRIERDRKNDKEIY